MQLLMSGSGQLLLFVKYLYWDIMENKKINWKRFRLWTGKVLNSAWKIALVIIGAFILTLIVAFVNEWYGKHYGEEAHYWDRKLSENILVHYSSSESVRVYDANAGRYVTPKLKWVAMTPQRDSLTVFCNKDGKRGFLNVNTGEIVIDGRYEHAWVFSEGLAAVVEHGGKMGFINSAGEYVIAPELDYIASHNYVFKHNVCCIEDGCGCQGLLNREGKWVLPQEYSFIDYVEETDMFIPARDGKKGMIKNGSFEWVFPMEYDDISWTDAPSGKGYIMYKDFRSQHVSVDGTVIDAFLIDGTYELRYLIKWNSEEDDEYATSDDVISFRVHNLWGMMDKHTGKVLIPAKYADVELVSKDIVKCRLESGQNDDCVLYDIKGKVIEQKVAMQPENGSGMR